MADLRQQRRVEELDEDREALEHIARALEGALPLSERAAEHRRPKPIEPPALKPQSVALLLETLPEATGILARGTLAHANTAFARAFGYESGAELIEAGGLEALLRGDTALFRHVEGPERTPPIDAITRSGAHIRVGFALELLDAEAGLAVLRLLDRPGAETHVAAKPHVTAPPPLLTMSSGGDSPSGRLDFLAKVSHEVRTPLNSILGFTELMLQERFGPIGNARYTGYIEDIRQSGLYALSLLNDLLDISKIEAGKFELDFTAVDVAEIVEDCAASLQPLAKHARIVLRTSLAPDLPLVVADPRRLKQILLNLLTNAIKFTKEGGQVIVSGTMLGGELRLRVRDTGVGMTHDEIAYAMQPFHQLDTAPRQQAGTGLGLPVTKALVDANRARLELTSERGAGTSADVIFPAERLFKP
jgi:two-component sensor histidine kinase